ncbi:hypothetical protein HETIRDRAFT_320509 [Heterobasidion irregulare TC 32-1]|uniref:C2H2-type domain-containing protein n=1 Tax=Heterobasidion irregulare (strain TC 32-1) TaxID=747525 RepID=W4K533_HETIT|nr:uncharacterized protein HETIRDRAFT_320509 [Heterobasidion irregulare TC 32-1]ETW80917.1 hypothetical protein HETIRDRAFT_320509 [Heterobasidion irregulare TC 32-1]
MVLCTQCYRDFAHEQALHAHCRDKADHPYCTACERLFVHDRALEQHLQSSAAHQDSSDEYEEESEVETDSESESEERYCHGCTRWFVSRESLYQHLASSSRHNWCFVCSRDFGSEAALDQHSSSRVHKDRNFRCPLCGSMFKFPSSIAHHVESGACNNISRHQVTAAVHRLNIVPTISLSHRITGPGGPPMRTIVHYSATEQAFNGSAYECYLCHRTFRTLASLNMHLGSAAHDEDEFECPKCKKTFTLISALVQHIESEVCGAARFKQVEDIATQMTGQFARMLRL